MGIRGTCKSYWENRTPTCAKTYCLSCKREGADSFEFAAPETAEVVSGGKNFKTVAKIVGKQTLRKQKWQQEKNRKQSQSNRICKII